MSLAAGIRSLRQATTRSLQRAYSRGSLVRLRSAMAGAGTAPQWRERPRSVHWERTAGFATEPAGPSGFASEHDYNVAADATLERVSEVVEQLEEHLDDFESSLSQGVLNIQLGSRGTWVLNKQGPNQQIWWSSPISGPLRYEYDAPSGSWRTTRDGRELFSLLQQEVQQVTGVELDLQAHH